MGGYLEFFMKPTVAVMFQTLRQELDQLIQSKVSEHETLWNATSLFNYY